nr:hypothetical protein [uncultured Enterobacter sp.]
MIMINSNALPLTLLCAALTVCSGQTFAVDDQSPLTLTIKSTVVNNKTCAGHFEVDGVETDTLDFGEVRKSDIQQGMTATYKVLAFKAECDDGSAASFEQAIVSNAPCDGPNLSNMLSGEGAAQNISLQLFLASIMIPGVEYDCQKTEFLDTNSGYYAVRLTIATGKNIGDVKAGDFRTQIIHEAKYK